MPKLTVHFWDGTTKPAANREEAVRIVKTGLEAWMEKGDKIIWYLLPGDIVPPSRAYVGNEYGEETDAWATISRGKKIKQQQPTLAQENNKIAEIFMRIKVIAETYLNQGYPAAPDPDEYLGLIEEQVKNYYDTLVGNQETFKVVGRLNPYWNEQLGKMMLFYKHPLSDIKAVKIVPSTYEILVHEKTLEEFRKEAEDREKRMAISEAERK